jgi:hypothetical protein
MPETKKKIDVFGHQIDVTEVPVAKADEKFVQYELEDGSVLKVKGVAASIMRVDDQFLPDGSPVYIVAMNPVVSVLSSPLKKPPQVAVLAGAKKTN